MTGNFSAEHSDSGILLCPFAEKAESGTEFGPCFRRAVFGKGWRKVSGGGKTGCLVRTVGLAAVVRFTTADGFSVRFFTVSVFLHFPQKKFLFMKPKFLNDFRDFAMKGNVMDLAVGVIIGGAFGSIVSSLVADIIMPLLGLLMGGVNFAELQWVLKPEKVVDGTVEPEVVLSYGKFLQSAFDFIVIAFSIFLFIRLISKLDRKKTAILEAAREKASFLTETFHSGHSPHSHKGVSLQESCSGREIPGKESAGSANSVPADSGTASAPSLSLEPSSSSAPSPASPLSATSDTTPDTQAVSAVGSGSQELLLREIRDLLEELVKKSA